MSEVDGGPCPWDAYDMATTAQPTATEPLCSEEAAFQAALDAHPDDHNCRAVYADWLDERDDERGPGHRALAAGRLFTENVNTNGRTLELWTWFRASRGDRHRALPDDWFDQLPGGECLFSDGRQAGCTWWKDYRSQKAADDAAALAFARLPAGRQAELLAGT